VILDLVKRARIAVASLSPVLRKTLKLLVLMTLLVAGTAGSASAAGSPAVTDCNAHGQLTQHYSVAQLHTALATMPADMIQRQLLAQVSGTHVADVKSPASSGSSFLPTPVIIALAVVVLGGGALAGVAIQRRSGGSGDS
jgi:hypothetical protein